MYQQASQQIQQVVNQRVTRNSTKRTTILSKSIKSAITANNIYELHKKLKIPNLLGYFVHF